jgi:two-component system response regulator YesN
MYQILIVDDDMHAVEGIRSGVDWEKLGISAVHTAFNIRRAKEVFSRHPVQILLSDIEMPKGSGLDLLRWTKEHYPHTETIFLTSHANFGFANQAIKLGSMDYILKPIPYGELQMVIAKAIDKLNKDNESEQFKLYGRFWLRQQQLLVERFWFDIINRTIPSQPEAIKAAAEDRNVPYNERMKFVPVLIGVRRWHRVLTSPDEKLLEYALKNYAEELNLDKAASGILLTIDPRTLLAVYSFEKFDESDMLRLKQDFEVYIDSCNHYFYCDLCCYIGEQATAQELPEIFGRLMKLEKSNVAYDNKAFLLGSQFHSSAGIQMPDIELWTAMLEDGSEDKLLTEVTGYLDRHVQANAVDAQALYLFHQRFLQMIYHVLNLKRIQAHELLNDPASMELLDSAVRSVANMISWVQYIIGKTIEYFRDAVQSQSVIERVKSYIKMNMEREISREDIAEYVNLNADYLNRVFKKETGSAIVEYLLQQRLNVAQELLAKTDIPISVIASRIGYSNFSHFSRLFKKYTNTNPTEFRQKNHEK